MTLKELTDLRDWLVQHKLINIPNHKPTKISKSKPVKVKKQKVSLKIHIDMTLNYEEPLTKESYKKLKARAGSIVAHAIKRGIIKRQPCRDCGTTKNVHVHHPNYTKPLKVIWLCVTDHAREHAVYRHRKIQFLVGR